MWLHQEVRSLADLPRYYARKTPDNTALIDPLGKQTFAQLDQISSAIASSIVASGVKQNSHIGFLGKNSSRYFELLFGSNKAGCGIAPFNWRLPPPEMAPVVEDSQTPLVFVDAEFEGVIREVAKLCSTQFDIVVFNSTTTDKTPFDSWLAKGDGQDPLLRIHPQDTALLIYTSGTTGKAKGVQLTHGGLNNMRLCEHLEPAYEWQDGDVMLTVMPVFHLVGSGLSVQALYNGAAVSLLPALDPGKMVEIIQRDKPAICALVPTAIQMVLDHPAAKGADFSSLRLIMYAGSAISSTLLKRALTEMKCKFMQFYGATESSGALTLLRPEQHDVNDEARLRSCGTPLPLIEFRIMDPEGNEVPDGERGEFWVRMPNMFGGYWNQPEAYEKAVVDGVWYRTGDAGYRDEEGLLYIVDRVKDMIITGGENVYSAEVEQALAKHPGVRMCCVIGLPDEKWGERVTAVIIPNPDAKPTEADIIAHCKSLIAGYKVPKEVRFVEELPMTATGKVLKRAVRTGITG